MTLSECYAAMGGDYNTTITRLGSDGLVKRLLGKFAADGSMKSLEDGVAASDAEAAFRAAHTLKGLALNLGFTPLANSSSALTEQLRPRVLENYEPLLEQVRTDYRTVISAIEALS